MLVMGVIVLSEKKPIRICYLLYESTIRFSGKDKTIKIVKRSVSTKGGERDGDE